MSRVRAPTHDGEVLAAPGFDSVPALVAENRRKLDRDDVRIGGLPLRELRALARREVLELANGRREPAGGFDEPEASATDGVVPSLTLPARQNHHRPSLTLPARRVDAQHHQHQQPAHAGRSPDAPLLLAGHQPELSHPGVWVKNFALCGLAKKLGGIPLHLVVDNDTLKSAALRFPVFRERDPSSARLESLAFDKYTGPLPYESRRVLDPELFRTFPERATPLWANWGYEPLLARTWRPDAVNIEGAFARMRVQCEREWGCHNRELAVCWLPGLEAFRAFVRHILDDLPRFRAVYNAALRDYRDANGIRGDHHPAPDLADGEAPFWVRAGLGPREKATVASNVLDIRPRALTLTLFARVCLGDFFIHGIGGGKYDEVTDAIIRDYFGIEPPAYQVLSATLHLPLPGFPSTEEDVKRAERHVRDLHWNPQRHLSAGQASSLSDEKAALAANEPPHGDHAARRRWFRELQRLTGALRPFVADRLPAAEAELAKARAEAEANAILKRRDYSWVLYPEATLRPFLQRFLEG